MTSMYHILVFLSPKDKIIKACSLVHFYILRYITKSCKLFPPPDPSIILQFSNSLIIYNLQSHAFRFFFPNPNFQLIVVKFL